MMPQGGQPISEIVQDATLDMSQDFNVPYLACKEMMLGLLQLDEEALYNIGINKDGSATTRSLRHVMRNAREVEAFDLSEALLVAGEVALASQEEPMRAWLGYATAGLYLVKTIKKATEYKIEAEDASILIALCQLEKASDRTSLLRQWKFVVAESPFVDAPATDEKLSSRLEFLANLGCLQVDGDVIRLVETIEGV